MNVLDNDKTDIGSIATDKNPMGEPINPLDPYSFTSRLPYPLVIVGEHANDSVLFAYDSLHWTSRTTGGRAGCTNGGWYPVDGPVCHGNAGNTFAVLCLCHPAPKSMFVSFSSLRL